MKKELVSVVMPVCDEQQYLKQAIESILHQTYDNLELIIVDSSTDHMSVKTLAGLYGERVRYFYLEKQGIGAALNYGIARARGTYLARMDADDIAYPERLEKQVRFLEQNPSVGVLGTGWHWIDENGKCIATPDVTETQEALKAKLLFHCPIRHPSVMFRKGVFEKGWKYDERKTAEDYDLWTRLILHTEFANLQEPLTGHRIHGNNASGLSEQKVNQSAAESARAYLEAVFGLRLSSYQTVDFYPTEAKIPLQEPIEQYLARQVKLLLAIDLLNRERGGFDRQLLICEIRERLQRLSDRVLGRFADPSGGVLLTIFQNEAEKIQESADFLGWTEESADDLYQHAVQEVKRILENRNLILQKPISFVIYGAGARGLGLLKEYERAYKENGINWRLAGIIDKKTIEIGYGENRLTRQPDKLSEMEPDYILISSKLYEKEIRDGLERMGTDKEKMISGDWLCYVQAESERQKPG